MVDIQIGDTVRWVSGKMVTRGVVYAFSPAPIEIKFRGIYIWVQTELGIAGVPINHPRLRRVKSA